MDEEKEKQIQEMTDKIFREMKEKEKSEQIAPKTESVAKSNPPKNPKGILWKFCGVFAASFLHIILLIFAYRFIHSCDNSGNDSGCGQGLGWTIIIFGIPYLTVLVAVASINLTLTILIHKQLKQGKAEVDYPASYVGIYYAALIFFIISLLVGVVMLTPIAALFAY